MVINSEAFAAAMAIIAKSNSPVISINVPVEDSYSNTFPILIHESNADLINKLIADGFSCAMSRKGLVVNYWADVYEWNKPMQG